MLKKTLLFPFTLAGLLGFMNSALAVPPETEGFIRQGGMVITRLPDAPEGSERGPFIALDRAGSSKDYEEIEKRLQQLLEELKQLEKDMEKRMRKEVLPHLRKEIERLKKWLRQFRMKEDDREPIKT